MPLPSIVTIQRIEVETRWIRTFILNTVLPEAEPGQFVMLWLPGVDEKPFSIAHPNPLMLTVARVGPFSTALHRAREGDRVGIRGPFGRGFSLVEDRPALLVGGGYGIAPLYFLAVRALERGVPVTVVIGARRANDLIYVDRFRALGLEPVVATDDGSLGIQGTAVDAATQLIREDPSPVIYACGPEPMLVALVHLCREYGLPGQLSVERYMKCGFGICGQCALDGLLVCLDGPVFSVEQLAGLTEFGRFCRSATGRQMPI
ncbi:MAG: dihydroorotate dehydrogenase electron transfer subunit [Anaerolineae bacterium]|nr:dihydroorotate dehydrogenase electron transfer subunit [Anaerolineae bacterium]MDW7992950.1 dihydroorotate dehydrogenase electron transfer subunit [Anaerolineae bacterium]